MRDTASCRAQKSTTSRPRGTALAAAAASPWQLTRRPLRKATNHTPQPASSTPRVIAAAATTQIHVACWRLVHCRSREPSIPGRHQLPRSLTATKAWCWQQNTRPRAWPLQKPISYISTGRLPLQSLQAGLAPLVFPETQGPHPLPLPLGYMHSANTLASSLCQRVSPPLQTLAAATPAP